MAEETTIPTQAQYEQLMQMIGQLQKAVDTVSAENLALKKQTAAPKEPELPTIPDKTFDVHGKTYKFVVASFRIPQGLIENQDSLIMTAKDALTDDDMLLALVLMNSGIIKEVV